MNVLIISRCTKRAREESCRILDQFAERTGDAAWQTVITLQGLNTLRKLLRKTARRNTAVACHWLKKSGETELLWIVGNLRRFNAQGRAPTNRTRQPVGLHDEQRWRCAESVAVIAAIAGLFHDFGKANNAFQASLEPNPKCTYQPYRHEWISVRLFQAFAANPTDAGWLEKLEQLPRGYEKELLGQIKRDTLDFSDSPLTGLEPVARLVAWLILSHHRLPQPLASKPQLVHCETWIDNQLTADWNSLNQKKAWKKRDVEAVWKFSQGTPLRSKTWIEKARQIGKRARQAASLSDFAAPDHLLTQHLARMSLMLADHFYSSQPATPGWQDEKVSAWANTDRATSAKKQKLDEHNVGVAHHALLLGRSLPGLRRAMPAIGRHKIFRERATEPRFHWQNRAWDIAVGLREASKEQGFFGVNMASTGCGKTFANARIMYALSDEQEGCRFSVALGLRTLTLQTGRALQSRLKLNEDDIAVLTGSPAVRELMDETQTPPPDNNSISDETFFAGHQYVHYEGSISHGVISAWLTRDAKLNNLVSAPVLVTTIDHLMPATEGVRGGRQIPPMLRLLTSDLVLDEPDDFDIADLPAVCRLVHWAGMLGSRVLLSSATLPPAFVETLFEAYRAGRKAWQLGSGKPGRDVNICCAWFDEYDYSCAATISDEAHYQRAHAEFALRRARKLPEQPALRLGKLLAVEPPSTQKADVIAAVAEALHRQMLELHEQHHEQHSSGKTLSFGLVRLANINPLVAVAQQLMAIPSGADWCIHYCVYHSRHPLAVRSMIEKRLDAAFTRHQPEQVWQLPEVQAVLHQSTARHHLFVVLATSVVEVGRDWDADWGIIEPSSMRSLIQFAGRIQRHRQWLRDTENLVILNKNIRALQGEKTAYCRPGFETATHTFPSHDLTQLLPPASYRVINAIPRIIEHCPGNEFSALEHARMRAELIGSGDNSEKVAALWWRAPMTWHGELQRLMPFRNSDPQVQRFLSMEEEDDEARFSLQQENGDLKPADRIEKQVCCFAANVQPWFAIDYREVLLQLAEEKQMALKAVSLRYGEILLDDTREDDVTDWLYHPQLGVFRALS